MINSTMKFFDFCKNSVWKLKLSFQLTKSLFYKMFGFFFFPSLSLSLSLTLISHVLLQMSWKWKRRLLRSIRRLEQFIDIPIGSSLRFRNDSILDVILFSLSFFLPLRNVSRKNFSDKTKDNTCIRIRLYLCD